MTNKEKVLKMYPNAVIYIMNEKTPYPMFYVQYWSRKFKWEYLACRKKSEEMGWDAAWDFIRVDMLKKLEE